MNITKHARERFCERFNDTFTPEAIEKSILEAFEGSEFIAKGRDGKSFFINSEHTIFVIEEQNKTIVTLYPVDYGFSDDINKQIAVSLVEKLTEKKEMLEDMEYVIREQKEKYQKQRDMFDADILLFEAKLNKLRSQQKTILNQEDALDKELDLAKAEISTLAYQLTYSKNYKMELLVQKK